MILDVESRSTRSLSADNLLWKRLWACRETDCVLDEWLVYSFAIVK